MADILKSFRNQYVPVKEEVLRAIVVHGDQLTEECARNVQWTFKIDKLEKKRLNGLEVTFSESLLFLDAWPSCLHLQGHF